MCSEAEYQAIVDRYADSAKDFEIPNGRPEDARYLIYKLFSVAEDNVRLYTGNLAITGIRDGQSIDIYGWPKLIDSVSNFLKKRKARLKVIVQNDVDGGINGHPLLTRLKKEGVLRSKVEIKQLKPNDSLYKQGERHFLTVDNKAYRMEMKDSDIKAVANFNDPIVTTTLISIFDRVFPRAVPLTPAS